MAPPWLRTLHAITAVTGGEVYAGGLRANIPAPGHSPADRSVSLLLVDGRLIVHSFGSATWQDVVDDLRRRGLIGGDASAAAKGPPPGRTLTLRTDRVRAARRLWDGAGPLRPGHPATLYCRRRAVRGLAQVAGLRAHSAAPLSVYRPSIAVRPALLAALHTAQGEFTAVEITYLDARGRRADALRIPRKTVGLAPSGSAVRLAPAGPEMLTAEGVFTTLSAMARFGLPGWALLSAHNLRRWTPPDGVRRVLIAADRGAVGEAAARRLADQLIAHGVAARVRVPPPGFGDWNDVARWEGRRKGERGRPDRGDGP